MNMETLIAVLESLGLPPAQSAKLREQPGNLDVLLTDVRGRLNPEDWARVEAAVVNMSGSGPTAHPRRFTGYWVEPPA